MIRRTYLSALTLTALLAGSAGASGQTPLAPALSSSLFDSASAATAAPAQAQAPDSAVTTGSATGVRPSLIAVAAPQTPPQTPTRAERMDWYVDSVVSPKSLGAGVISAAWSTALNKPEEYHGTWKGFGKRYAVRLGGVVLGNGIEAGLGSVWGEDPRYTRASAANARGPWRRTRHAALLTVMAYGPEGQLRPAYARYAGVVGQNALSTAWRPESEQNVRSVLTRSALGLAGRFFANAFEEFWPDIRERF